MKSIGSQGEMTSVELMRPMMSESGEQEMENDLSSAQFDVTVDVGPSSSSKRASTVRALTGMAAITEDPETKQVLGAMAMMNMEGEGIEEVRDYFRRKLLNMGVVKPTEEEAKQLKEAKENAQPDANTIYMQAAAQEASANAALKNAQTVKTIKDAELTEAKTIETMTNIDASEVRTAMEVIDKFGQSPQPPEVNAVVVSPNEVSAQPL